jgi:hypothetical protein
VLNYRAKQRHGRCQDNSWIGTAGTKQLGKKDQAGKHEKRQRDREMESLHPACHIAQIAVLSPRANKFSPFVFLTTFGMGGSSL